MIALAAVVPYVPFLTLPFISDSYLQIALGRGYGPPSQWAALATDVLYRSRATSIFVTFVIDRLAGADPFSHHVASIFLHFANSLLVLALGAWPRIGWRVSLPAAIAFALCEVHQEAVVWIAALPELLVFFFVLISILTWLLALARRSQVYAALSFGAFVLALLSKESAVAVIPVAAAIWFWERRDWRRDWQRDWQREWRAPLFWLAGMTACSVLYATGIFVASATHLHLNDGTFSFGAPFLFVLAKSIWRTLLPWGWVSLAVILTLSRLRHLRIVWLSLFWMVATLLPYSFLTYMDRVPSRHTYLASLGLALLIAGAFVALRPALPRFGPWPAYLFALVIGAQSLFYLWTKKLDQYSRRVEPTERFLRFAAESPELPVRIVCAPYGFEAFRYAAHIRLGTELAFVSSPSQTVPPPGERAYCDPAKP